LPAAIAVVVGTTIGSGIFRSPANIAREAGSVATFFAVWIVAGAVALIGALAIAELAAARPRSGGLYVYLRDAYGDEVAFCFGWAELLVLRPAAYGAISLISAEYTLVALDIEPTAVPWVLPLGIGPTRAAWLAIAYIVALGLVNLRGVSAGAWVQGSSTILKIAAMLVIVALGLAISPDAQPADVAATRAHAVPSPWTSFGLAMVAALWAYDGWADLGFLGGEVKDPSRTLPRAFVFGTVAVIVIYLALNVAYVHALGWEALAESPLVAADVATAALGPAGARLVALAIAISTFGTLNGSLMTGPRIFWAMAVDGAFFPALAKVDPITRAPVRAIVLSMALGALFVSVRGFAQLSDQFVTGIWPFYALSVLSVVVMRRRDPARELPFRASGAPWLPVLFVVVACALLVSYAVREPLAFAFSAGVIVSGWPVFAIWRWRRARSREHAPGAA
jgi:amino acid transporter